MDEQEAVRRLRRGDIRGLEALVTAHQVRALRAANMIVRDRSRAEDIVQGVFLRAYQQIGSFDPSRPFRPWLMRMVVNESLRATTGRVDLSLETPVYENGSNPESIGDLLPDQHDGPEAAAEAAEFKRVVWEALGGLIPQERTVVTLRYYLDCSEQEMAEMLNCPPGTVKWRLHEARKHLKAILQPLDTAMKEDK